MHTHIHAHIVKTVIAHDFYEWNNEVVNTVYELASMSFAHTHTNIHTHTDTFALFKVFCVVCHWRVCYDREITAERNVACGATLQ